MHTQCVLHVFSLYVPCVFPVFSLCFPCMLPVLSLCASIKHFFIPKTKVDQNYAKRMLVEPILCFAYIFGELGVFLSKTVIHVQFTKTIAFWRLSWCQANFHDIKHPFRNKKHFFIPKAPKTKVAQNYAKRMLVEPILCLAYIFGELGVFLSKTVSQVQFTKTIAFWSISWFPANFYDIKHSFYNKKHFFTPKSTKKLLKIMQNNFW